MRCSSLVLLSHIHVARYICKMFSRVSFDQIAALSNQFIRDLPSRFLVELCFCMSSVSLIQDFSFEF